MSQHTRSLSDDVAFPVIILVGAAAWAHRAQIIHISYLSLGVVGCLVLLKLSWVFWHCRSVHPRNIDTMDGLDFEQYVAGLLKSNGFRDVALTERYDFGVDIIAEKDGVRWGVQTKRHSGPVKADAVRQVVTGLNIYDCDRAMVITNSTYGSVARRLARANNCVLIDRAGLKKLSQQRSIL